MNEERLMILQMLKDGAVSVEEAERLLAALAADDASQALVVSSGAAGETVPSLMPKRICILVTEGGKNKVNVRVPFSLVRAGLKLGQSFSGLGAKYGKLGTEEAAALEMLRNLDVDELLGSIVGGDIVLPYTMVDVDDEENGQHVSVTLQ